MNDKVINNSPELLSSIFIFGLFFSSITLNLIPGETSPLPGVAGLIILLICGKKDLNGLLIALFSLILSCISCMAFVHENYLEIFKQLIAYSQVLIVFLSAKYIDLSKHLRLLKVLIFINLLVYFIQITGIGSTLFDPILSFLISRGSAVYSVETGRGIAGLTSEPSHLAASAFVHSFLLLTCGHVLKRNFDFICIVYLIISLLASGSGTGVALFIIFLVPFVFKNARSAIFISLFVILALIYIRLPDRLLQILDIFKSMDDEMLSSIFYVSGFRFPSVVASYVYSFNNFSIGGAGSWFSRIVDAYVLIGVDIRTLGHFAYIDSWTPTKPTSLFATICLEFGFIGLLFSIAALSFFASRFSLIEQRFLPYFCVAIFGAFALSTVGNPSYPLILALATFGRLNHSR